MLKPSSKAIEQMAQAYSIIPVCKEIYADVTTPITLLRKLAQMNERYFLLESVEGGEKWGRYSFLGFDPIVRVVCKQGVVTVENGETKVIEAQEPLQVLRDILAEYKAPRLDGLPPFTGGFVGYFAYSMLGYAEPSLKFKPGDFNDYEVMLFDKVIAYDHLKQKISLVVNMKTDKVLENYGKAVAEIEKLARLVNDNRALPEVQMSSAPAFQCNISKRDYCAMVNRAKNYIYNGDIFQAVVSRRFETEYHDSLLNAYRVLRATNPSPYMVFMKTGELELISTSPETLVKLQNGRLTTFPVAGSRPRGASAQADAALTEELLNDEKELAEHNMLVDLARNDVGKIAKFDSVEVTDYKMIHRYSKIMHITSTVEGDILADCDACDAIKALLPAGTLSGAPKIRACEIIEKLETEPRGLYGGAIGYLDFTGNLDTCIAIRMAVKKNGKVYVQAGGGIVADSVPEIEYEESENKAKAVIDAILRANEVTEQ